MPHDKPIGIDLGTTNSAMAWVDEAGRSAMIPNAEGEFITPSVVFFSESEVVVGKNARTAITSHPEMVAQWVKRDMGAAYYSHPIRGHYLPPEVIQACILRKLKADLARDLGAGHAGRDHGAGLFRRDAPQGHRRRRRDGRPAGAGHRQRADGRGPGLRRGPGLSLPPGGSRPRQELNVLVYDLGGGTFDVTLLRLAAGKVQTLATDGDVQLGGHDWDQRLVDYAAECFLKTHQLDPRQDPATLNRLYLDAMEAKHTLSARSRAVDPNQLPGPLRRNRRHPRAVRRNVGQSAGTHFLHHAATAGRGRPGMERRAAGPAGRRLDADADGPPHAAGPLRHSARSLRQSRRSGRPRGRAVCRPPAGRAGGRPRSTFQVTNVNAHSLGVEGIDTETLRKKNVVLIPRNTPLPARHTERFATKSEGQRSIVIKVLEGESSQPGDCIAIGRTVVRDLPSGLPKGWPVEVTFEYGANGRLAVEALVPGTHHQARLELVRETGLSNEGLTRWKQPVGEAGGFKHVRVGGPGRSARRAAVGRGRAEWNRLRDRLGAAAKPAAGARSRCQVRLPPTRSRLHGCRDRCRTALGLGSAAADRFLPSPSGRRPSSRGAGGEGR